MGNNELRKPHTCPLFGSPQLMCTYRGMLSNLTSSLGLRLAASMAAALAVKQGSMTIVFLRT